MLLLWPDIIIKNYVEVSITHLTVLLRHIKHTIRESKKLKYLNLYVDTPQVLGVTPVTPIMNRIHQVKPKDRKEEVRRYIR